MATGCVKILKKAYELDHLGKFIPKNKRGEDVDLFRGELSLFHFHTNNLQTFTLIIFWVGKGSLHEKKKEIVWSFAPQPNS